MPAGLCRDCFAEAPGPRCASCGSPRLLVHPERDLLSIAHVDCDAFYAAIEKRDDPSLRDKPVIIGGRKRGVVSTACYLARTAGVHSAMPMFKALKACPGAVVIKPDMEKYKRVGREMRARMLALTPQVEPVSIDEAFLDLSGTERLHHASPALTLARFAKAVEVEVGITVSVGLSHSKFLAKIASDFEKPRGFSIIGRAETVDFLADKPIRIMPGIGAAAAERLRRAGILVVGDLRRADPKELFKALGREAERLVALANGIDRRRVQPEHDAKSVSAETTFDTDHKDFAILEPILWRLSERVAKRLRAGGLGARSVTLKLKETDFQLRTRSRSGLPATQLASRLFEPARQMLRESCDGTAYRLIGIGASDLCEAAEADRADLLDTSLAGEVKRQAALDRIREKFGDSAVQRGLGFRPQAAPGKGATGKAGG